MDKREHGIALISVLWVVALLSVVAAGVSASTRNDLRLAGNLVASAQARSAAEGGVQWALYELLAGKGASGWQADGSVHELSIGEPIVRVTMIDEAGKLDLNAAPESLLDGLLRSAGLADDVRRGIVDAILDWRDADSVLRPHGAEDPEYRAAGKSYGAKDAPFDSVEELSLVLGMSPQLLRAIKPALTVHSRQAGVNPNAASRQVLLAIPSATAEEVDRYIELRERNRQAGLAPPAPPLTFQPFVARAKSAAFSIHAQARLRNGVTAHVTATVELRRAGQDTPFAIRAWRHEGPELFSP